MLTTAVSNRLMPILASFIACLGAPSCVEAKPNIVIILADDMGYGDVHALNPASNIPTPNIDGLAAGGMTFTDGHSPSAVCTPTRYGLLTGRYCWRSSLKRGVLGGYSPPLLEQDQPTIASMLHARGYHTGAIGKWHLGMQLPTVKKNVDRQRWDGDPGIDFGGVIKDSPIHHGFDYYFGVSASLDMAPYVYVRNDRFTMAPTAQQPAVPFPHFVRKGPRAEDFVIQGVLDRITNEAVKFVTEAAGEDTPFFLYLPLTAPHKPTQPHPRFKGKTKLGEYGDFVAQVDWSVGQVLRAIDKAGVADNTVVFYTSDNGSYMRRQKAEAPADHTTDARQQAFFPKNHRANGSFRGTKADIYEAGHHVPLLVRWPGTIEAGSNCDTTVCLTDLFATCALLSGEAKPAGAAPDSFPFNDGFRGAPISRAEPVIHHSAAGMFAIRDGQWKLIAGNGSGGREQPRGKPFGQPYMLFHLGEDLSESKDVAADHPEVVARLTKQLQMLIDAER